MPIVNGLGANQPALESFAMRLNHASHEQLFSLQPLSLAAGLEG